MNEHELTALLDRGSRAHEPDVEALVAGAADRGRRSLRRRRVGTASAAALTIAALAAGATFAPGWLGGRDRGVDTIATQPPSTPGQRVVADADLVRTRITASLPDGDVTDLKVTSYEDGGGVQASLLLDGDRVEITAERSLSPEYFTSFAEDMGQKPGGCDESEFPAGHGIATIEALRAMTVRDGASARCLNWVTATREAECVTDPACWDRYYARYLSGNPCLVTPDRADCRQLPDGGWLHTDAQDTAGDTGGRVSVQLSTVDRFQIRGTADGSSLSPEQLAALATSDVWFTTP